MRLYYSFLTHGIKNLYNVVKKENVSRLSASDPNDFFLICFQSISADLYPYNSQRL